VVWDIVVGIATLYRLDGPGIEFAPFQTWPGAHPDSCTTGTASFLGVKRLGRGADHPLPSSAEVKEGESYTSIDLFYGYLIFTFCNFLQ